MLYVCGGDIPELTGKRLKLRRLEAGDAEAMLRCWSDEEVRRYSDLPEMSNQKAAVDMIELLNHLAESEDGLRWGIVHETGELMGSCGFNWWQLEGAYRGEISCEMSREFWGQGYMGEALEVIIRFGFQVMGLNRIEALTDPDNKNANRLFRALQFQEEGCLRAYLHTDRGFVSANVYSLLRNEWINQMVISPTLDDEGML